MVLFSRTPVKKCCTFGQLMKCYILILLHLLTAVCHLSAQSPKADSLQRVLQTLPSTGDTAVQKQRAAILYTLGGEMYYQQQYPQSRAYYREALRYLTPLGAPRPIANALGGIAFGYHQQGRFPEALDTFLHSLKYYEQARDTGKIAQTATSIANIYMEMPEQNDKALSYARYCMDVTARAKRLHGLCACTHLVGSVYIDQGKLDSAALFIQQSLQLLETQPDLPGLATVYLAMARLEEKRHNFDRQSFWLNKVISTQEKYPDGVSASEQANTFIALAHAALNRQETSETKRMLDKIAPLMPSIQDITYYERYYDALSRLALLEHRPEDALKFYQLQIAARDSSRNEENTRRMTQIQMQFDFEKKEAATRAFQQQELALRDARTRQQQLWFGLLLMAAAGSAGFGFYYYRQKQERRRTELELASLRAQINPHFIFNCLNSIYRYTKERDTDTAGKYLQKFSSLLRLVLENSRHEKITLAKDLQALQLYVDIESLRFKDKLRFQLDIDPEIDPGFTEIPGMLLQPHVENAIWHGIMPKPEGGLITVKIKQLTETQLQITIEDNGVGRAAAALQSGSTHSKSLGQKITAERLKASGKLTKMETVDLYNEQNEPAGTRVIIVI